MATVRRTTADLRTARLRQDWTATRSSTTKAHSMRKVQKKKHGSCWYVNHRLSVVNSMANKHVVLALRPMCLSLRRHRSLDHPRSPDLDRTSPPAILHYPPTIFGTNHRLPRTSAEPSTTLGLFPRLNNRLQRAHARRRPSLFASRCIWCRDSCMDGGRILVFLVHLRRPWRSRRAQRW